MGRSVARIVAVLLLGISAVFGIVNGIDERANPYSPFQRTVYFGVVLYGVLGLVGMYGMVRRRSWSNGVAIAWALAITFVASTASLAYGGPGVTPLAAIAGGASGALVGAFVVWAARMG